MFALGYSFAKLLALPISDDVCCSFLQDFQLELHVFFGPDHLAVVAPLVAENPSKGLLLGFRWGFGHGLGLVFFDILGMLTKGWVDVDSWSTMAEVLVGRLLIAFWLWNIWSN